LLKENRYVIGFVDPETSKTIELIVDSQNERLAIETAAQHLTKNIDATFLISDTIYITVENLSKVTFH